MATVHLICGPTGAGKTTYARRLAADIGAVRFSIDEWMAALFEGDTPEPLTFEWAIERVRRCENQIWQIGEQLVARGVDVVLDIGFTTKEQRDEHRGRARDAGADTRLHHVVADADTRRARVKARNADHSEVFAFEVTDKMFDFMERRFEAPGADEKPYLVTSQGTPA